MILKDDTWSYREIPIETNNKSFELSSKEKKTQYQVPLENNDRKPRESGVWSNRIKGNVGNCVSKSLKSLGT